MFKHIAFAALLLAQWLNYPAPGVPRLPNGKVDLSAKAPRTRDGKPDLSGVWQTELETPEMIASRSNDEAAKLIVPGDDPTTFSRYFFNILADFAAADAPMTASTREYMQKIGERKAGNPSGFCLPHGLPQTDLMSYAPFKIVQTPTVIAVLYELDNNFGRSTWTAAAFRTISTRRGADIQSADGKATRLSSTRRDSTIAPGSTWRGIRTAKRCASRSVFTAVISATWT